MKEIRFLRLGIYSWLLFFTPIIVFGMCVLVMVFDPSGDGSISILVLLEAISISVIMIIIFMLITKAYIKIIVSREGIEVKGIFKILLTISWEEITNVESIHSFVTTLYTFSNDSRSKRITFLMPNRLLTSFINICESDLVKDKVF